MPTEADSDAAAWFDMFGHKIRVALLRELAPGEKTTSELARLAGVEKAKAQPHLEKLRAAGLVTSQRYSLEAYYALAGVTRTETGLEFTHPSGARAFVPLKKPPAPPVRVCHHSEEDVNDGRAGKRFRSASLCVAGRGDFESTRPDITAAR